MWSTLDLVLIAGFIYNSSFGFRQFWLNVHATYYVKSQMRWAVTELRTFVCAEIFSVTFAERLDSAVFGYFHYIKCTSFAHLMSVRLHHLTVTHILL